MVGKVLGDSCVGGGAANEPVMPLAGVQFRFGWPSFSQDLSWKRVSWHWSSRNSIIICSLLSTGF